MCLNTHSEGFIWEVIEHACATGSICTHRTSATVILQPANDTNNFEEIKKWVKYP